MPVEGTPSKLATTLRTLFCVSDSLCLNPGRYIDYTYLGVQQFFSVFKDKLWKDTVNKHRIISFHNFSD
jgi:hypothetical protein